MAIWDAIKEDHDRFDALFEAIEDAEDAEDRAALVVELANALEVHAQAEEQAVYPELEKIAALNDRLAQSREDHAEMRRLVQALAGADEDDQLDLLSELEDLVQDHVEEEEDEVIPAARKAIGDTAAEEMLRRFEAAKKTAVRS